MVNGVINERQKFDGIALNSFEESSKFRVNVSQVVTDLPLSQTGILLENA